MYMLMYWIGVSELLFRNKLDAAYQEQPCNGAKSLANAGFLSYLRDIVFLIAGILLIFSLLFRVVVVSGPSMNKTLIDGDYILLLNNIFYSEPRYGDVIVACKDSYDNGSPIIKRVIAT